MVSNINYYISDLHFGCTNKYEGRILDHDKFIKENWNKTVTNGDTVYILGDIGREGGNREMEYLCEIISTLKGKKVLIQGNHEKLKDIRLRQLFVEIVSYKEITDNYNGLNHNLVLSHYPIFVWNNCYKGWLHLYGHTHENTDGLLYQESLKRLRELCREENIKGFQVKNPPYAFNVGAMCEYINYTPRTLKEILEKNKVGENNV